MSPVFSVVGYYEEWWVQILKSLVIFVVGLSLVPMVLIAERKVLGRMQNRYGPNRVGPFGVLQPLGKLAKSLVREVSTSWIVLLTAPVVGS